MNERITTYPELQGCTDIRMGDDPHGRGEPTVFFTHPKFGECYVWEKLLTTHNTVPTPAPASGGMPEWVKTGIDRSRRAKCRPQEDPHVIEWLADEVARLVEALEENEAKLESFRRMNRQLRSAGRQLANAAYNLSQWGDQLGPEHRESLKKAYEAWDTALLPSPQET